jgi:hypothetical protein
MLSLKSTNKFSTNYYESESTQAKRCAFEVVVYIIYNFNSKYPKTICYEDYRLWIINNYKLPLEFFINKKIKPYVIIFIEQIHKLKKLQDVIKIVESNELLSRLVPIIILFFLKTPIQNNKIPLKELVDELIAVEEFHLYEDVSLDTTVESKKVEFEPFIWNTKRIKKLNLSSIDTNTEPQQQQQQQLPQLQQQLQQQPQSYIVLCYQPILLQNYKQDDSPSCSEEHENPHQQLEQPEQEPDTEKEKEKENVYKQLDKILQKYKNSSINVYQYMSQLENILSTYLKELS